MNRLVFRDIRNILVRSPNWIGDAVMTTPAMGAIRAAFPDAEITVVANPSVAELLSPHPYCDDVIVFDRKGTHGSLGSFTRFCMQLRAKGFDLAILLQNAIEAAVMAYLARIPRRVGFGTDARGFLLSHSVPMRAEEKSLHHTDYYLHMLSSSGIHGGDGKLRLYCTDEEIARAKEQLGDRENWIAINPGATYGSAKRWFADRFAATADAVSLEFGANILILGGRAETKLCGEIQSAMRGKPLNLAGRTSVRRMMALLSRCRFLVTNDSGPMHVAAAFGIPIVALFGPTDHTTTSPRCDTFSIVRKPLECAPCLKRECPTDHRCMEAITVEDVLQAVRSMGSGLQWGKLGAKIDESP
jgi:heptosyltransferase-2